MSNTNTNHPALSYINEVLATMPTDWLKLTTHRLDIYDESQAKTQFLDGFETLFHSQITDSSALAALPTAYDYIRLGHPLSSILEWGIAQINTLNPDQIISFSSNMTPLMAVLRKNLLDNKNTRILYSGELSANFDAELIKRVYGYHFDLEQIEQSAEVSDYDGSTVLLSHSAQIGSFDLHPAIDFYIQIHPQLGSILLVNGEKNKSYISAIQHVRRRETIAMTPANCLTALQLLCGQPAIYHDQKNIASDKKQVHTSIKEITHSDSLAVIGSSGLSVQYSIMMGLIHEAMDKYPEKAIKFLVPPNCYGGTNDQARRVAACLDQVEVMDLFVDGDNDMVQSTNSVLDEVARLDAIPFIIAEIPTNPRVEVPDLKKLNEALSKSRQTPSGEKAIEPVFILDQTFCPNVNFLGDDEVLAGVKVISYVSGSKFPSGGKCTAGYAVANKKAASLMDKIALHMQICDNEATELQMAYLSEQLPSMNQRIEGAYKNTREFVNFIKEVLPTAKINFVSEELAAQGFTPSVFSLDLPTKGNSDEERENYKRALNHKLISMMITEIPNESKYCVSYGQLKGCYWTIPATSTQGTTKEGDKDYIARVALSANMDLERHKQVFKDFVRGI